MMNKRRISTVLLAAILLQSCVAYQTTSVSIKDAQYRGKVKLINARGDIYKFSNVEMSDSIYYGINDNGKIRLETDQVSAIYLQDIKKSKTQSIVFVVSEVVIGVFGIIGLGSYLLAKSIEATFI